MPIEIVVPEAGESVVEATVSRWLKQEGDLVAVGEAVVELETDKVNLEVAAEKAGVLTRIERREGEDVEVGEVLGIIEEREEAGDHNRASDSSEEAKKGKKAETRGKEEAEVEAREAVNKTDERVTPMAKRLAEEHGVNLAQVSAGAGSRITRQDVESYLENQKGARKKEAAAEAEAKTEEKKGKEEERPRRRQGETAVSDTARRETRERMSRRRQTIAQRLVEAQHTAAMLTTFNEVDMSAVIELRKRRQESFVGRHEVKLGFMSFFVKAAIGALKAFPALNAEIDGEEMVFKHYYDIGMAVGAEEGLVVPVLRSADRMTFAQIERTIQEFVEKVRDKTLSLEDLRGGTFTITNGGVFGSLLSTPILNTPQVGILGLHKIEERPVVVKGEVVVRPMMYVALSYDHRIVDGREAVQFLVRVKELIEEPEALLLEG
jgi:2-oxoglutarate dehydrogenase E2 component (dihydrolipoamide succinyltransferase)